LIDTKTELVGHNPYSETWIKNIELVFGKNKFLWFFPVGKPLNSGYFWKKN